MTSNFNSLLSNISALENKPRTDLDPQKKIRLQKAVRDFEALLINQMLKSMRSSIDKSDMFGEENMGGDIMNSMFDMELSRKMSDTQGFGISNMLYYKLTGEKLPKPIPRASVANTVIQNPPQKPLNEEFRPVQSAPRPLPGEAKTLRERVEGFNTVIEDAAKAYNIDSNLIKAVIASESRGNPEARSPKDAKGIMQLIDSTAKEMGVQDVWDPRENIFGGARYLRTMLDQFDGDIEKTLASYNAGPGAVKKYNGIPPYKETQQYVKRTMNFLNYFRIAE